MEIFKFEKICTDSHYKKSIAQVAGKVKSFPINYGWEFPRIDLLQKSKI
ncbi:hypothetical protein N0824_01986 [Microcystis sp. 0824]|nr:hypothetical protein N0824_01986 [Microcystis sp. 0824]